MTYERVLVPVDRNETTVRAVKWGLAIGDRQDVPVDLLHVVTDGSGRVSLPTRSSRESQASVAAFPDGFERLVADAGERVSRHVVSGVPHEEIVRVATEQDIDLIVMGQDGKTGVNNRLFDSVTDKVIRGTSVPVLAVPDGDRACRVEQVLLPISDRITTVEAIEYAATAAKEFQTSIHVVKIVDTSREAGLFDAGGVTDEFLERLREEAQPAIDRTVDRLADLGVDTPIETEVVHGLPHETLEEYIGTRDVDLVIAGGYGSSRIARRVLGDVTEHLLQTASVPVLVVSDGA